MITLLDICVDISYLHLTRNKVVFYQLNTDQVKADKRHSTRTYTLLKIFRMEKKKTLMLNEHHYVGPLF